MNIVPATIKESFLAFDRKVDGSISFFAKHYGKSKFMVAMSKKVQYLGIEKLWEKGPKAFFYFFLFYLVRDVILYIVLPIFFTKIATH
ncbi:MAG: hypothetical protein PHY93_02960 [Bacteriovorax sp.]|nr:hypothetical protein [Bacteriovorax sp.]